MVIHVCRVRAYLQLRSVAECINVQSECALTCEKYLLLAYLVPKLKDFPRRVRNFLSSVAVAVDADISEHLPAFVCLIDNDVAAVVHFLVLARAVCMTDDVSGVTLIYLA